MSDLPPRLSGRRRAQGGLSSRAREVVELMVFGVDGSGPMNRKQVAAHLGIREDTCYRHESSPLARRYYRDICREQREAEVPRNTIALVGIRDDGKLKDSAAGARARIEAIRTLEGAIDPPKANEGSGAHVVSPGIVVQVSVNRPDRVVDETIIEVGAVQP